MLKTVTQEINNLIGTKADIEALAKKDHARVLVLSDTHGQYNLLETIVKRYGKECDAMGFCGDGAGDLAMLLSNSETDKDLKSAIPPVIAFVQGNGDPGFYPLQNGQSIKIPESQILTVNGRNLMFVHGHREGIDFGLENYGLEMQVSNCKVGFFGHTHIAYEENSDGFKFVNPGSVGRPRGGQPKCFAIATVEKNFVDVNYIKLGTNLNGEPDFQSWIPIY